MRDSCCSEFCSKTGVEVVVNVDIFDSKMGGDILVTGFFSSSISVGIVEIGIDEGIENLTFSKVFSILPALSSSSRLL